jgi:hypothetical protein
MRKMRLTPIFLIVGFTVFGLALSAPNKAGLQVTRPDPPPPINAGGPVMDRDVLNPKIEYALGKLYNIYLTKGADEARAFAAKRNIDLEGNKVRVVAEAVYSNITQALFPQVSALKSQVQAMGGTVETTYQNLIQSRVPIATLETLADNPLVRYLRMPLKPVATTVITSEGVNASGANLWQSMTAYRNPAGGANVCVLDLGFQGYGSLLGTELPASVTTRSFRSDGNIEADEVHGAACAEIVHDMAPNANLTLVNFSTDVEQHNAVDWITSLTGSQKIDVLSYSIGWYNAGDGKGTGPICADVNWVAANGTLWVGAAGNDALDHFEGTFNNPDNNSYYNFPDGSEFEAFYVPAYTVVGAYLNWDDWGTWDGASYSGSNNDYDLFLYYWNGSSWVLVDSSQGWQDGFQPPVEDISGWYRTVPGYWGVRIYKWSAARNCKMELFVMGNSGAVNNNVQAGSLLIPGDSASSITVGAVDWSDNSRTPYHTYSSQGPTHDGRIKPDISGYSRVTTSTYGNLGYYFSGTSAATPCVAGAIALMKEKTPYGLTDIWAILQGRAGDLGDAGNDSVYGVGYLSLKKK